LEQNPNQVCKMRHEIDYAKSKAQVVTSLGSLFESLGLCITSQEYLRLPDTKSLRGHNEGKKVLTMAEKILTIVKKARKIFLRLGTSQDSEHLAQTKVALARLCFREIFLELGFKNTQV